MSFDIIIPRTKAIEAQLRRLGYRGKGLHELVSSAGDALPRDVSRAARKVASIRNKVVHDDAYTLTKPDLKAFLESAAFVTGTLTQMRKQTVPTGSNRRKARDDKGTSGHVVGSLIAWRVGVKVTVIVGGAAMLIALLVFGVSHR